MNELINVQKLSIFYDVFFHRFTTRVCFNKLMCLLTYLLRPTYLLNYLLKVFPEPHGLCGGADLKFIFCFISFEQQKKQVNLNNDRTGQKGTKLHLHSWPSQEDGSPSLY